MNLDQFKNESVRQGSVSKYSFQGNSWKDGGFLGECVSEISQGLQRMHGITSGAWGDAKAWANPNHPIRQWFDSVPNPQAGDIGVDTSGKYGHIWWYLPNNQILEQNGRVARTVTVSPMRGANAILRRKGTGATMRNANDKEVRLTFLITQGREVTQSELNHFLTLPLDVFLNAMFPPNPGYVASLDKILNYDKLAAENAALKKQIEEGITDPDGEKYRVLKAANKELLS